LAERYGWTPAQVDAMDPSFIEELLAYWAAQSDVQTLQEERAKVRREIHSG
jgi:hypothetical protein